MIKKLLEAMISSFKKMFKEEGGAIVEFGLILPIFLLLIFAVIEYGWFFTHEIVLTNAVNEGARRAVRERNDFDAGETAIEGVREAFWLKDLGQTGEMESVISAEILDEEPKRIIVAVSDLKYQQLTGFLPSVMVPEVIGAKAVMTFP